MIFMFVFCPFSHMAQRTHDQEEHQDRRHSAERSDKQISKYRDRAGLWHGKSENDTDDQSADDTFDKTDVVPF